MPRAVPVVPLLATEEDARRLGRSATASRFRLQSQDANQNGRTRFYVQNQRTRRNKDVEKKMNRSATTSLEGRKPSL